MSNLPFFSIILPTHKRAKLLARALKSIKSQMCSKPFEVLVVSDVIDPDTDAICSAWLTEGDMYLRRSGAAGPSSSRNLGLRLAKGKYVLFLDDDDAWHPGLLEKLLNSQQIMAGVSVYFNCSVVVEKRLPEGPVELSESTLVTAGLLTQSVYVKNQVHMSCFAFPRGLLQDIRFDETMRAYEDWEYLLSVFDREMPTHLSIIGSKVYEVHDETTDRRGSTKSATDFNAVLDYLYVYRRHPAPDPLLTSQRAALLKSVGLSVDMACL